MFLLGLLLLFCILLFLVVNFRSISWRFSSTLRRLWPATSRLRWWSCRFLRSCWNFTFLLGRDWIRRKTNIIYLALTSIVFITISAINLLSSSCPSPSRPIAQSFTSMMYSFPEASTIASREQSSRPPNRADVSSIHFLYLS